NPFGKNRVNINPGDVNYGPDGGEIRLHAADESDPQGPAIIVNAAQRSIVVRRPNGEPVIELGPDGHLYLGGAGIDGEIVLRDSSNRERVRLKAGAQSLEILASNGTSLANLGGPYANLAIGGAGQDGDLM